MGKHNQQSHFLHIPKAMKFKQQSPSAFSGAVQPQQKPQQGTSAQNMFK